MSRLHGKVTILFLIDDFCGPEGGTEQHLLFLQRELPRQLFDLHFGVLAGVRRMAPGDFPVKPVMLGHGSRQGRRGAPERLRRLVSLIREVEPDVIHAFCCRSEQYAILAARLARRGRVLGVRRNIGYRHTWRSRWTTRLFAALGAEYAANCEAARQFAARVEWISPRRTCLIQNPVSSRRLREGLAHVPARSSLGIAAGERVVAMVANVRPVKDYATFLHAARLVLQKHPATRFLAIGWEDSEYARRMRRLAHDLAIDGQISWTGPIGNPFCVLPLVDVAVLSSRSEAFSNAVLEYAAAGVAAVASDVGGISEIIDDGTTGYLVPPGAPEALAERTCRLLSNAGLRRTMGNAARQKAQTTFSEERILREYDHMYARLAQKNSSCLL